MRTVPAPTVAALCFSALCFPALTLATVACEEDSDSASNTTTVVISGGGGNFASSSGSGSGGFTASSSSTTSGVGGASTSSGSGGASSSSGTGGAMPTVDISFSNCAGAMCDFTFNAVGFGAQDGKTIYVGVQQQGQMGNVTSGNDTISAGSATVMTTMSLTKNQQYNVNYFVDVDGNSLCEIGGQDLIWRESLTATGHVTIDAGYTTGFSNLGCSGLP